MKWRIRHRKEGWTGTAEIVDGFTIGEASHSLTYRTTWLIIQDRQDPAGNYVEDPDLEDFTDLEFLERVDAQNA